MRKAENKEEIASPEVHPDNVTSLLSATTAIS